MALASAVGMNSGWRIHPPAPAACIDVFLAAFDDIPDPRADNARHDLGELLVIAFVAVLCGATTGAGMAMFGRAKERLFRDVLKRKHAIASHDTFSTVFRMIDPKALDAAFGRVLADVAAPLRAGDVIAVDGTALRGAPGKTESARTRDMVSAYAARLRLTLASRAADNGTDLDAALEVLGLLALKGKVVTGDARHCNRRAGEVINARGGDWCLALKRDQDSLVSDARACFGQIKDGHPVARHAETGHGRTETRFFALSWLPSPEVLMATVRAHWAIENALHWQLDVSFCEDAARNRKDNAPTNIAVLRRRALDVVRRDPTKVSLSMKLQRAGWDDPFRRSILKRLAAT